MACEIIHINLKGLLHILSLSHVAVLYHRSMKESKVFQNAKGLTRRTDIAIRAAGKGAGHKIHFSLQGLDRGGFVVEAVIYNNIIAVVHENGTVTLSDCGWRTPSTSAALNQVVKHLGLGGRVYRKNFEFYYELYGEVYKFEYGSGVNYRVSKLVLTPSQTSFLNDLEVAQ